MDDWHSNEPWFTARTDGDTNGGMTTNQSPVETARTPQDWWVDQRLPAERTWGH